MSGKPDTARATDSHVFVIKDKLRPADVILALGREKFSDGIASVTKSSYSHAILVVSPIMWFEADDEGVGYSHTWGGGSWLKGLDVPLRLLEIPDCCSAEVFRHPAIKEHTATEIEAALERIVEPWEGEDYSDYRRLFSPLNVTGRPRWWIRIALAYQQWRHNRRSSGMFCSEVIARVFEKLEQEGFKGASLFNVPRRADLVHPGHIATSRLNLVKEVVIYSDRLPQNTYVEVDNAGWERRFPTKVARLGRSIDEGLKDFNDHLEGLATSLRNQNAATFLIVTQSSARLEHQLREAIDLAQRCKTPKAEQILNALLVVLTTNFRLIQQHFESESSTTAEYRSLCEAQVKLAFRVREAKVGMVEEFCSLRPDFSRPAILESIKKESVAIDAERKRALQTLDDIGKRRGG